MDNHKLPIVHRSIYFCQPHVPNGGDVDVLDDNVSTHTSSIVDIDISV